jgi:hypothetical protein
MRPSQDSVVHRDEDRGDDHRMQVAHHECQLEPDRAHFQDEELLEGVLEEVLKCLRKCSSRKHSRVHSGKDSRKHSRKQTNKRATKERLGEWR